MKVSFAIVMTLLAVVASIGMVHGQSPTPSECAQEKNQLENTCRHVLFRQPSAQCCQFVRVAHPECVCPFLSPKLVVALRGANRIIRMVGGCGRQVPRNFKCGSVTTP